MDVTDVAPNVKGVGIVTTPVNAGLAIFAFKFILVDKLDVSALRRYVESIELVSLFLTLEFKLSVSPVITDWARADIDTSVALFAMLSFKENCVVKSIVGCWVYPIPFRFNVW